MPKGDRVFTRNYVILLAFA